MLFIFLLAFLKSCNSEPSNSDLCCENGNARAQERLDCLWKNETATNDEDELCAQTTLFCCRQEYRMLECRLGTNFALAHRHCKIENSSAYSSPTETCCTACLTAQLTKKLLKKCANPGMADPLITHVFEKCCQEANQSPQSTSPKPQAVSLCDQLPGQLCQQVCVATHSSYYCSCHEGYVLMEDHKTCQLDHQRPRESKPRTIIPNPEKPVPLIRPGKNCENFKCKPEEQCAEAQQGPVCNCRAGFKRTVSSCEDINECLENEFICDQKLETCENQVGSYRCKPKATQTPPHVISDCMPGYHFVNNSCQDIDECSNKRVCGYPETCINTRGSYVCRCAAGFHRENSSGPCVDINECQVNNHMCLPEQRCDNTMGSYICHRLAGCGTGYTLNFNTNECEDDDECLLKTDNCNYLGSGYQCRNTQGSFRCVREKCGDSDVDCPGVCPRGFARDPATNQCLDIDECLLKIDNCDRNSQHCVNRRGSYGCEKNQACQRGFQSTLSGCKDIDECSLSTHNCSKNADCRNVPGSYYCSCKRGYQKRGFNECQDINECHLRSCPGSADCVNTDGSYRCICKKGFIQTSEFVCEDQNECADSGACDHGCYNFPGSYQCYCQPGFTLHSDNRTCLDVDECAVLPKNICRGICVNTEGGYNCECPAGYIERDNVCHDINECNFVNNTCKGEGLFCVNTRGSYECVRVDCPFDYRRSPEMPNVCWFNGCNGSIATCASNNYFSITQTFVSLNSNMTVGQDCRHIVAFRDTGFTKMGHITRFELNLTNTDHPFNVPPATRDHFVLQEVMHNTVRICLTKTLIGPQKIDLELVARTFGKGYFTSTALIKVAVFVSQYLV